MSRTFISRLMLTLCLVGLFLLPRPADAQVSVTKSSSVITIDGTPLDDEVVVSSPAVNVLRVRANGQITDFACPVSGPSAPMVLFSGSDGADDFVNNTRTMSVAFGGTGDDRLVATTASAMFFGDGGADILVGSPLFDTLEGGPGDDLIFGAEGSDIVDAGGGADTVLGGAGNDTIEGGPGADTIFGQEGSDTLQGGGGEDFLSGGLGFDVVDGGFSNDEIHGGSNPDTLLGGLGDDRIFGGDGTDTIDGGGGADTVVGGSGNDTIEGGLGADTIFGQQGADFIQGGSGEDYLSGGLGSDFIDGGSNNDEIFGGSNDDSMIGGLGDDFLFGGVGNDLLCGGGGADELRGGDGDDSLYGEDGVDVLLGGTGTDDLQQDVPGPCNLPGLAMVSTRVFFFSSSPLRDLNSNGLADPGDIFRVEFQATAGANGATGVAIGQNITVIGQASLSTGGGGQAFGDLTPGQMVFTGGVNSDAFIQLFFGSFSGDEIFIEFDVTAEGVTQRYRSGPFVVGQVTNGQGNVASIVAP